MQCSTCGFMLPAGATFCTNCGAKLYSQGNAGDQLAGSSQVEPTIAASSPYPAPPMNPSSNQQAFPTTIYGAPYSTPQQYSDEAPPPPPNTYGAAYTPSVGSYIPPGQPPTRRKGPRVGLIIGIIVLVLLVVGGGLLVIHAASSVSTSSTAPSGAHIDPTAAAIITNAQTASAVDSNDDPSQLTSNFNVGQTVYVTFNLTTNGQSGYAEAKLYSNTTYVGKKILTIQSNFTHGYFTVTLNQASTGTVELYWCAQSDCSDAKLATFVTFTAS